MLFEDTYRFILVIYSIFALSPFRLLYHKFGIKSQHNNSSKKSPKCVISIAANIWTIGILSLELCWLIYSSKYDVYTTIRKTINLLGASKAVIWIIPRILHIIITIETICKRNQNAQILDNLYEIDEILAEKLCLHMNYHRLRKSIEIELIRWILIVPFLLLMNVYAWDVYGLIYVISLVYSHIKLILNGSQYATYAILITHRIEAMHEVLDASRMQILKKQEFNLLLQRDIDNDDDNIETSDLQRLIHLRQIFAKIYDTIELMNDNFKWSISLNISIDIFVLAQTIFGHLQWFLDAKYENKGTINFYVFVTYTFYYVYRLALLIHMGNSVAESASRLAGQVHQFSLCTMISDACKDLVS